MSRTRDGDELVKQVFGASLYQQGRGFYVPLEFLAMVRGSVSAGSPVLSPDGPPTFLRRSHDFARRVLDGSKTADTADVTKTVRSLLRGLRVPVPGRRAGATHLWYSEHFYPYVGDLVHYDAVLRRGRVSVERYTYRGAGGLAHHIVRTDNDRERLDRTRAALVDMVEDSDSALGRIVRALAARDEAPKEQTQVPWTDDLEAKVMIAASPWVELLRSGLNRIVTRRNHPNAERIEALMHWVPFCVAMHQAAVAREACGAAPRAVAVDFRPGNNPVRKLAREASSAIRADVFRALELAAERNGKTDLLRGSQNWRTGPRTFVSTTLGSVGALNGTKGETYFTFGTALTQAVVLATVDVEMEFERFCIEVLHGRLGFVVDGASAKRAGQIDRVDAADFQRNALAFSEFLRELGLLQDYSDATRMVRTQQW